MSRPLRAPRALVPLAALATAATLLAACGTGATPLPSPAPAEPSASPTPGPDDAGLALEGPTWILVRGLAELPDGTTVDIAFEAGRMNGQGPCNRYQADATADGSALVIGPVGANLMSCGPALDGAEQAYFAALGRVASYAIEGTTLTLLDAGGAELLAYDAVVAAAPTGLPGSTWQLLRYAGEAGALVAALPDVEATMEFGADGRFGANAGCNGLGSDYTMDEAAGTLTFGMFSMTMMLCEPPALMAQESGLVAALERTASFAIEGSRLTLLDADGKIVVEADAAGAGA
jgi:heat shock protein HslJ